MTTKDFGKAPFVTNLEDATLERGTLAGDPHVDSSWWGYWRGSAC